MVLIIPGDRIGAEFQNGTHEAGILRNVTDSTIEVNNKTFSLDSIKAIGRRRVGASVIGCVLMGISCGLFAKVENDAISSHKSISTQALFVGVESILLVTIFTNHSVGPAFNYTVRRTKNWNLEVIDFVGKEKRH